MNKEQMAVVESLAVKPQTISISEISNTEDRTLLFGYTCDRHAFHVYIQNKELHRVIYSFDKEILVHKTGETLELNGIVPDKRLYPETCDFEFCSLLTVKGVNLPFTTFDESRPLTKKFYGRVVQFGSLFEAN